MTFTRRTHILLLALAGGTLALPSSRVASAQTAPRPSVFQTTLEELAEKTPEVTTEELQGVLKTNADPLTPLDKKVPIFDVRTAKEYAIAHIPGTINIYEKEVQQIIALYPDRGARMILYCNGPSCGKSKRTSLDLLAAGFTNVWRYQLGMPVWRALSQTVQTDIDGLLYIYGGDHTSVFVDARTPAEFGAATVPGATNIQKGEATAANDDGRLPFQDKGTRVVVFGTTADQAQVVAAEIAKKAYWNSSYFGGTLDDLLRAGVVNHRPIVVSRNAALAAGPSCTAAVAAEDVNDGSYDPDSGDALTLSVVPSGPLALGQHPVVLTGTDSHGVSASAPGFVTVSDRTAPQIGRVAATAALQRVPHHRAWIVTVDYTLADNCGPVTAELRVSRAGRGGDGLSWEVLDAHHLLLKAPRGWDHDDDDAPRWLAIAVVATDGAGNQVVKKAK